ITLASYEVSYTKERIIDIALRYGYNSNESFSRAFKRIHGINPSEARKNKVTVYTHFPVLTYDIPDQNLISLRYEIMDDINYDFVGRETYIKEGEYSETQKILAEFDQSLAQELLIPDIYTYEPTCFKVKYHLIENPLFEYHYLVGFIKNSKEINADDLINIEINAKRAIKFISRSITIDMIPTIKKMIYDEWVKNHFEIDGICEIEYTKLNDIKKLDFFYIVSIK
ncbi:MAG: helix-turn-helix domain-containing protein, partial [Tenericutes bacterium]|nr:helix-turn-helix domain-containing protein [Mycoplasmatota bacterium]